MSGPRIGALFAGAGGLDLAVQAVLGGSLAWVSEIDPAASKVLAHHYPDVPNHGDITAVDWSVVEPVDVLTGGFPCQDLSLAGGRKGLREGTRSGLWSHMAAAIDALQPKLVVIENVRGLLSAAADGGLEPESPCLGDEPDVPALRALGAVLGDLADLGLDAEWVGLRAADVGACHGRFRVAVVAWPAADAQRGERERELHPRGRPSEGAPASGRGSRPAADAGPVAAANPDGVRSLRSWPARRGGGGPEDGGVAPADPDGGGLGPDEQQLSEGQPDAVRGPVEWGPYGAAIRRWELILGRPAPAPTEPSKAGGQRLSPRFVEFMQGFEDGWVTAVPGVSRNDQLRILGNAVVQQQFTEAIRFLLDRAFGLEGSRVTDQEAVDTRAAARMVVLEHDAADVLEMLGLLPGQAIDAPMRLSAGWFDPSSGGLSARTVAGRVAS